jgi:hypothetical protein
MFKAAVKNGIIKGVSRAYHPLIEGLQPYHATDPKRAAILILHDLDVADEHRLLKVVVCAARMGNVITTTGTPTANIELILANAEEMIESGSVFARAIEDGIEVHFIRYKTTSEPNWDIENHFTIHVAFENLGPTKREPVIPVLIKLCTLLENTSISLTVASDSQKMWGADSGGSRPRIRDDVARRSEMISPAVPE